MQTHDINSLTKRLAVAARVHHQNNIKISGKEISQLKTQVLFMQKLTTVLPNTPFDLELAHHFILVLSGYILPHK